MLQLQVKVVQYMTNLFATRGIYAIDINCNVTSSCTRIPPPKTVMCCAKEGKDLTKLNYVHIR